MSAVGGGGNYISDGQIMAWLATQQDRIYEDLRGSMDLSEKRAQFADQLNNIKAELQQANASKNFAKVDADLQAFIHDYGSEPEFAELCKGLQGMADKIHSDLGAQQTWDTAHAEPAPALQAYTQPTGGPHPTAFGHSTAISPHGQYNTGDGGTQRPEQHYSDGDMQSWNDLIGGKLDGSSKNDQLTMIHIQELKATLDQGAQLGSTFISSGDKTSSAIINNIA
jgi:hypothetical protein